MTRIVLIGNCQIEAMLGFYRQFAAISRDQHITYIRSYEAIGDDDRRAIEAADIVVEQVQDFKPVADIAGVETRAERIGVPVVHGGFLWPFAGQPHPHNPTPPWRAAGPYGAETSDAWLNRLVKKGVAPDDAPRLYAALDVNVLMNLDRLLEISLEKQAARDALTGFSIADVIAGHFRTEPLFRTPYHPNVRIAVALGAQLFARLGVDPADTRRMQRAVRVTPFPKEELPVHPAVARHYGLTWATPDRRYRFHNEGSFTFDEFVRRYVACAWNAAIDEGMDAVATGDMVRALDLLTAAVAQSPRAAPALSALAHVLEQAGRIDEACEAARKAAEIEPDEAPYRLQHALLLARTGAAEDAERQMRVAAALAPFDPHFPGMLANHLNRCGAFDEAEAVARHGIVCAPYAENLHGELAAALDGLVRSGPASLATPAVPAQPDPPAPVAVPSTPETALAAIDARIAAGPAAAGPLIARADALVSLGRLHEAEASYRAALDLEPDSAHALGQLGYVLSEQGRHADAVAVRRRAVALDPGNPHRMVQLGHVLLRAGELAEAEEEIRRAITIAPGIAGFHIDLADVLARDGRLSAATDAARRAVSLAPSAVEHHLRLADLLLASDDLAGAAEAFAVVLRLAPDHAHATVQLGHVRAALAVATAGDAALDPGVVRLAS